MKEKDKKYLEAIDNLINLGKEVFVTIEDFDIWLKTDNFFLDNKKPVEFIDTIENIQLLISRLIGMKYGDNN